ncbi:MAG: transketolase [Gammaproteobacteria bacterium]|nr:transketolase [Gammaproteobacteria bacterium]
MHSNHQTDHKTRANAIRALAMDAVQKANSGHPGAPMGMADIAEVLWLQFLKHNPANPSFSNRDRFVLSNGHASMLLYSLLHLTGYELTIEDLKSFRQLHSKTPGHPELGYTAGVETTTGPLGAGIANAVGMAIAEKTLAAQFNRPDYPVVDHFTYCFLGDGCLMEGLSHEACSLAGTLGLGKLIAFWDDNGISIDGHVEGWFTDDTPARFHSYGWQVIRVDGHNPAQIADAITQAQAETDRPTLICCKTIIGFGSPNKSGSHDSHGSPLGDSEIAKTREFLLWSHVPFEIPADIYAAWDCKTKGAALEQHWTELFAAYKAEYPELAAEYQRRVINRVLPANFEAATQSFIDHCQNQQQDIASRKASQLCIAHFAALLPEVLGGSADLAGSNLTLWSGSKGLSKDDSSGNYIYYGVREFGMVAIMNGITAHGGFRCYGATFLMFMEYARNAVRMSALMKLPNIYVFTHDSIGQGEDGPTHQPIEQLTNLRTTPNLVTWRPADLTETAVAWKTALTTTSSPSALVFSRQNLRQFQRNSEQIRLISKGGYILKDCGAAPDIVLIATGSELQLACDTADKLSAAGKKVNVVSMPSTTLFDQQSEFYRDSVLPEQAKIVAIEAAHPDFWYKYVGKKGLIIGISSFGESAPGPALLDYFGFNAEVIANKILA